MSETVQKKVLALKYRPHRFEDLVGQSTISQTLSLALDSNRLSHAYLFSGLRGSGKTSTARIMAKALLCSNGPSSKPCEQCDNCISANANKHLDIIEMDAASNRGIDDIKDLIEHTKYKPSSARFKVFIIDEVHMLTTQAFNALLKTLEEPPGFVKFILATTDPLKLPATILSRTQHFRFNKISNSDVVHHLSHILNEEGIEYEKDALEILSRSGQGSLRDTLTMLDQAIIFSKGQVSTTAVVDMLGLIDPEIMDNIFQVVLSKGDISTIVSELENYEVSQVCDEMSIYLKDKMLQKDSRFDLILYDRFFRILSDAKHLLAMNSDGGFVLILTLMKMIEAIDIKSIDELINQVEKIEAKPSENTKTYVSKQESKQEDSQQEEETKIQEPDASDLSLGSDNVVSLDVIEESIPKVKYPTPFDDDLEELETSTKQEEVEQEQQEPKIEDNTTTKSKKVDDINSQEVIQEPLQQEPVQQEVQHQEIQQEEQTTLPNNDLYKELTSKVYERDYTLGECFEHNFIFNGYENNKLHIKSFAQGDDRKFLYKHFGIIRTFAQDIFGDDIQLEFTKETPRS
ncbi:MAG: DNA polymerase III subunit gamma/tau [Campylobacterota bacterium]